MGDSVEVIIDVFSLDTVETKESEDVDSSGINNNMESAQAKSTAKIKTTTTITKKEISSSEKAKEEQDIISLISSSSWWWFRPLSIVLLVSIVLLQMRVL